MIITVTVEPHRGLLPIYYRCKDGSRFVKFTPESNFQSHFDLPEGALLEDVFGEIIRTQEDVRAQ